MHLPTLYQSMWHFCGCTFCAVVIQSLSHLDDVRNSDLFLGNSIYPHFWPLRCWHSTAPTMTTQNIVGWTMTLCARSCTEHPEDLRCHFLASCYQQRRPAGRKLFRFRLWRQWVCCWFVEYTGLLMSSFHFYFILLYPAHRRCGPPGSQSLITTSAPLSHCQYCATDHLRHLRPSLGSFFY